MRSSRVVALLVAAWLAGGCGTVLDPSDPVEVRVINRGTVPITDIVVGFPRDRVAYGALQPGEASGYVAVRKAYRYAYVEARVREAKQVIQPIDYVGEKLLPPGRHTYLLASDGASLHLALRE